MSELIAARTGGSGMRLGTTPTRQGHADPSPSRATVADRIQGVGLLVFAIVITVFITSGKYRSYVTPRSVPYLVVAAASLAVFSIAAWMGVFHCTVASLSRTLVVVIIPTLLMALPIGTTSSGSLGGTNRAIAISSSDAAHLSGLDTADKTITISDDQFGAWFDQIDHHPTTYIGYRIVVSGFVSTDSSMGPHQFEASRMLMTCCVLDMTPFGFAVDAAGKKMPAQNTWVTVTGTLSQGRIGTAAHGYDGTVLTASSIVSGTQTPNGYFYRN